MRFRELLFPAFLSVCLVVVLDIVTNDLDTQKYTWDFAYYIAMAEDGLVSERSVAPFAYRFGATLPAHALHEAFAISVYSSFRVIAYIGAFLTLMVIYVLMRDFRFARPAAILALIVTGLSLFQIKFLLFDVYRPDHLAYPLIGLAFLFFLRRRWWAVVIIGVIGLQVREYLVIPLLMQIARDIRIAVTQPAERKAAAGRAVLTVALTLAAVMLPRLLIPVTDFEQNIDPFHAPATLHRLYTDLFNWNKSINFTLSFLVYMLPTLSLITRRRFGCVAKELSRPVGIALGFYSALVLVFALYGGTDYPRFMTYLFIPQCILLGYLYRCELHGAEIVYLLIVMVLLHRTFQPIPIWDLDLYLDMYRGYSNRVNAATLQSYAIVAAALAGAFVNRKIFIQRTTP